MLIYKVINKLNKKEYVGKTVTTLEKRKRYGYGNSYFQKALEKYGEKNFKWEILWDGNCSKSFLNELEKYYIYFHDTYNSGYNLTIGGESSPMSNPIVAKKCSNTKKGMKFSEEHKRNIAKANKGYKKPHFKGKKHSEKSKNKISKSLSKRTYLVITPNKNKYVVKNLNNFCNERNLNSGGMYFVANGEWSQYKGYEVRIM